MTKFFFPRNSSEPIEVDDGVAEVVEIAEVVEVEADDGSDTTPDE